MDDGRASKSSGCSKQYARRPEFCRNDSVFRGSCHLVPSSRLGIGEGHEVKGRHVSLGTQAHQQGHRSRMLA